MHSKEGCTCFENETNENEKMKHHADCPKFAYFKEEM
jgi:hypothetical protein